jgi:hypothetical protein
MSNSKNKAKSGNKGRDISHILGDPFVLQNSGHISQRDQANHRANTATAGGAADLQYLAYLSPKGRL